MVRVRATVAHRAAAALAPAIAMLLGSCATQVDVTPQLSANAPAECRIRARIEYAGKPAYLPNVLVAGGSAGEAAGLRYTYETKYGRDAVPNGLAFVNPLTIVGFPTGSNTLVVVGRLDVVRDGQAVRSYAAAAAMARTETAFTEGETFTAMRSRGLALVRDNIAAQLCQDREALEQVLRGTAATGAAGSVP
jgi:hypothetical protein